MGRGAATAMHCTCSGLPYASTTLSASRPSQAVWSGGHATAPGWHLQPHRSTPGLQDRVCVCCELAHKVGGCAHLRAHPVRALTRHLLQCRHVHVPTCLPAGPRSTKSTCCSTANTPRLHTCALLLALALAAGNVTAAAQGILLPALPSWLGRLPSAPMVASSHNRGVRIISAVPPLLP